MAIQFYCCYKLQEKRKRAFVDALLFAAFVLLQLIRIAVFAWNSNLENSKRSATFTTVCCWWRDAVNDRLRRHLWWGFFPQLMVNPILGSGQVDSRERVTRTAWSLFPDGRYHIARCP
ncbi:hypothetical protein T4C_2383 [Trichinella pseudospiralis]|uniref:Uncharacterized protein n=1 Tax=Trichinella pseudospiralis TaxID=6337 RepID=A0A0V1JTF9_TRIPS|nr:hypothetical protein T4C_2383 [Trichinella pseudospiralis]